MLGARVTLPPAYELITLLPGGQVLEDAVQRATEGSDEGTLIWSLPPDATGGSSIWPEELDCAVILRPEDPLPVAMQLLYMADLSIAEAYGERCGRKLRDPHLSQDRKWSSKRSGNRGGRARWAATALFKHAGALGNP